MRRTAKLFITFAITLIGSAVIFGQNRPLGGTEWKLVEANGRVVRNSAAAININENSTRFTGNTGCNQMFGTLVVRGRNIDFQGIVWCLIVGATISWRRRAQHLRAAA